MQQQKAGHFKRKAGKRDHAKKLEFTPESGTVDTYVIYTCHTSSAEHITDISLYEAGTEESRNVR